MKDTPLQNSEFPLVSVIVPIYNDEQYLTQCVDSLLNQTLKNIEIILVDDGSTDNCPAICDAYADRDKRVRVIHKANGGYGKACNIGINTAGADFFGIIESDDYAEPEMFECLYDKVKSLNLDIVRCHYYRYNSGVNTRECVDLSHIPQNTVYAPRDVLSVFTQTPAVWSMLYRKNFIVENNIRFLETPGASYQDTSFAFKVFACAERFMLLGDTFVHYRIDSENSSSTSKEKVFFVCDEYREIERFIEERDLKEKLLPIIPKIKFSTYMWNYRRLTGWNRRIFLGKFAEEMRRHITQKAITRRVFSMKEIFKVFMIAYFYFLFCYIKY